MLPASEGISTGSRVDEKKDRGLWPKFIFVGKLLARDRSGALGLIMFLIVVLGAVFAAPLAPHDPLKQNLRNAKKPPVWSEKGNMQYPLGTDNLGRDLLSRIIYGTRVSVTESTISNASPEVQALFAYAVVITTASLLLFEFVWNE